MNRHGVCHMWDSSRYDFNVCFNVSFLNFNQYCKKGRSANFNSKVLESIIRKNIFIKYRTWRPDVKNTVLSLLPRECMSRYFLKVFFMYAMPIPVQTKVHFENLQFLAVT